jgi:hypothetical protein
MDDRHEAVEHELKTWPDPFQAVKSGAKPFEYRRNDRDFRVGDTLWLREWRPSWPAGEGAYTGDELRLKVTFVLAGGPFGVPKGFAVLGIEPPSLSAAQAEIERLRGELQQQAAQTLKATVAKHDAVKAAQAAEARASELERERDEALASCFTEHPENGVAVGWDELAAMYRAQASASQARVAALEAGLRELADSLEEEIKGRADNELPRRIARGLEPVRAARALLEANSHD